MKLTFAAKTFSARTFRSATLAGPVVLKIFKPVRAAMFVAGAVVGRCFHTGADIGQHFQAGATAGMTHG